MPRLNPNDLPTFIDNINTNIIMKKTNGVLKRETNTRLIYIKVLSDGELDIHKSAPLHRIKQHIFKGFCIECKSYIQARYEQALLRISKTNGVNKVHWLEIANDLQDKHPELLI